MCSAKANWFPVPHPLVGAVLLTLAVVNGASESAWADDQGTVTQRLRSQVESLVKTLDQLGCPLPQEALAELAAALAADVGWDDYLRGVERVLDPFCLVHVAINPESRVKAARGPAEARLSAGRLHGFLIRVHNEAGVTQALAVTGPQVRNVSPAAKDAWLEAEIRHGAAARLTGLEVEYLLLCVRTNEVGKREATLIFDVGQGSQDLGFRAEVPILFTIHRQPTAGPR